MIACGLAKLARPCAVFARGTLADGRPATGEERGDFIRFFSCDHVATLYLETGPDLAAIPHIEINAFEASVQQLDNPELRGKPGATGGQPTRRGGLPGKLLLHSEYVGFAFRRKSADTNSCR